MDMYTFSPDVLELNPQLKGIAKGSKYGNIPTTIDGHRFASKKEARDYRMLKLWENAGQIANLKLQPKFKLAEGITYIADFMWDDLHTGKTHVLDSKGFKTKEFRIKEKLFRQLYPQYTFEVG
jgi:hypothetical protein